MDGKKVVQYTIRMHNVSDTMRPRVNILNSLLTVYFVTCKKCALEY